MMPPTIYQYVQQEESRFETEEVQIGENWWWNFRKHVQLIFHLKNGMFYTGENNYLRAFKAVMEPMLNLAYWTEDLEVKDVVFYIESENGRVLSFLVKKYHDEVYTHEHDLDTMFDEITESDLDYGGVLVQRTNGKRPEVIQLNTVAFCDQTDTLGTPIALKYNFSPSKLRAMSKAGWGEESNGATISIDELCTLASDTKDSDGTLNKKQNRVTGKTVEVYIVRGYMPEAWLLDNDNMDDYYEQVQVVAFYVDKKNKRTGVTLYRNKQVDEDLMFHTSKAIHGRGLGRGVGESLIHPQIWTNFLTIHKMAMLEAGSKVPLYTDDSTYTQKNKIQDMETLEVTTIEDGKRIYQVPTVAPANIQLIQGSVDEWFEVAQLQGSAFDPILGKEPVSGTTFRGQERTVAQGRGAHDRRRGQRAKFIEKIYRAYIIPDMVREIVGGKEFLATLSADEARWVVDQLATNYANSRIKESLLGDGELITAEQQAQMKQTFKELFSKRGEKNLIKILKDEFKGVEIKMGINIAGKQKNLADLSDKILSIFQFAFANPDGFNQAMQNPALAKGFQDILEFSGMSQTDFSTFNNIQAQLPAPEAQTAQPITLNQPVAEA